MVSVSLKICGLNLCGFRASCGPSGWILGELAPGREAEKTGPSFASGYTPDFAETHSHPCI